MCDRRLSNGHKALPTRPRSLATEAESSPAGSQRPMSAQQCLAVSGSTSAECLREARNQRRWSCRKCRQQCKSLNQLRSQLAGAQLASDQCFATNKRESKCKRRLRLEAAGRVGKTFATSTDMSLITLSFFSPQRPVSIACLRVLFRTAADSSSPGFPTVCNTNQHILSMAQAMHLPSCQLPRLNRSAGCSTSRAAQSQPLCRPALRQPQHARQSRHRTAAAPIVAGQPQAPPQMAPR